MKSVYFGLHNSVGKSDEWEFEYKGSEILPNAKRLLQEYKEEETSARKGLSELSLDKTVAYNSDRVKNLEIRIQKYGRLVEQLTYVVTGLKREPDRTYKLSIEDMAFFELEDAE